MINKFFSAYLLVPLLAALGSLTLAARAPASALELTLSDGSVVRSTSRASYGQIEPLHLERGTFLLSTRRSWTGNKGVPIIAGAAKADCRGTVLVSRINSSLKIVCLEGNVVIRLNNQPREFLQLREGQMMMASDTDESLPAAVEIDIRHQMNSCALFHTGTQHLPGALALEKAAKRQARALSKGLLAATTISLNGNVVSTVRETGSGNDTQKAGSATASSGGSTSASSGGSTSASTQSTTPTSSATVAASTNQGGTTTCLTCVTTSSPVGGPIALDVNRALAGRKVDKDQITSPTTRVPAEIPERAPNPSGRTNLEPVTVVGPARHPASIMVANSTDIAKLTEAFQSVGSETDMIISDGVFERADGQLKLIAASNDPRTIEITRSVLAAETILARTFHTGGRDALLIQDSTLRAAQIIELFAEGDSVLRFRGHVTLDSPQSTLAGAVVHVDPGGVVDARGNLTIYTDAAQFNIPGRGSVKASGTRTVRPYELRR